MLNSEKMARSVMSQYKAEQMQWHYEHGLVLQSIFQLGQRIGQDEFCAYVKSMYDSKIAPNGSIRSYREQDFNLDQINPGKTLFLLYKKYGEEQYKTAIETLRAQLRNHPRTKSGGFWHKQIYPWQMWLDGLYMQGPFYAQYASEYGSADDFNDIALQFTLIESMTRDAKTGLLYHAWDESREQQWANPHTGCSPHFWGRAMGWYCMALADVLEFFPVSDFANREALITIARNLCEALLRFQDPQSGLWYQILDKGAETDNYTESSASSMFIYFLLKIIRLSFIHDDNGRIALAAHKAYQGLVNNKLTEDETGALHLHDICKVAGLGGSPYRDGSYTYYVNEPKVIDDFKGIGPFILASMEIELGIRS